MTQRRFSIHPIGITQTYLKKALVRILLAGFNNLIKKSKPEDSLKNRYINVQVGYPPVRLLTSIVWFLNDPNKKELPLILLVNGIRLFILCYKNIPLPQEQMFLILLLFTCPMGEPNSKQGKALFCFFVVCYNKIINN